MPRSPLGRTYTAWPQLNLRIGLALAFSLTICQVAAAQTPPAEAASASLQLSLQQAIELGLKNNLGTLLAHEQIAQAKGEKGIALSALLPNIWGTGYQANLTSNLAAMGFPVGAMNGLSPFIGPFNQFDARLQMFQNVFNLASIRHYQAGSHAVALARQRERLASQQVATATTLAYLGVLAAEQSVDAAQANVQLAQRLLDLATSRRNAGVATGVDVARAETRVATQQVELADANTSLDTARLQLLRTIGLPLTQSFSLSDPMPFRSEPLPVLDAATRQALADRVELAIAKEQLQIAEAERKASVADWIPSVSVFGNYGSSGLTPSDMALPTRDIGVRLDVPVFNGGRTRSNIQVASSRERQAELQLKDLEQEVQKDVSLALKNLATREEQVRAAQKTLALSERELQLAQDRFANGVGDNVEVVNAQTVLALARQVLVASLAQFNTARLNLAASLGRVEDFRL